MTAYADMPRLSPKLRQVDGRGPAIWCPACDAIHVFDQRWTWNGDVDKPTFSPSFKSWGGRSGDVCHSFVTDGRIQFLADSTHTMAGTTVDLIDWPEAE